MPGRNHGRYGPMPPDETAAAAAVEIPVVPPTTTAGAALGRIHARHLVNAHRLAVCSPDGVFMGIVRLADLLTIPHDTRVDTVMDSGVPVVTGEVHQEVAAARAIACGEARVAVVDGQGRFLGLIPAERIVRVLLREHEEDLARLGGFHAAGIPERAVPTEGPLARFRHRFPWLLLGLSGSLLAAGLVGSYQTELESRVMLAFFLPGVVYLADAVGTQTEALVVRGLSIGEPIEAMARADLVAGVLLGGALALATYPFILWRWGAADIAATVALTLFLACSSANLIALALPYLLSRLGSDPAFGSGPLATVLQDLLSIMIYFAVARAML